MGLSSFPRPRPGERRVDLIELLPWPRFTGRRRPFLSRIKVSHTSRLPHPVRGSLQKRRAAPQEDSEAETCHHIPLNESGQTLEMPYSRGITKEELSAALRPLVTFDSPSARIGGIGRTEQPMHRQGMEKCRKPLPEAKTQSRIPGGKRSSASPDHHPQMNSDKEVVGPCT